MFNENLNSDKVISRALCLQIFLIGSKNILVQGFPTLYNLNGLLNSLLFIIVGVIYLHALVYFVKQPSIPLVSISVLLFIIVSFLINLFIHPYNEEYIFELLPKFTLYCIVTFLFLSSLNSLKWVEHYSLLYSKSTIIVSIITAIEIWHRGSTTTSTWSQYSMPLSYVTLTASMWLMYSYFNRKRRIDLIFSLAGIVVILAFGSRNPLLAIGAYLIISNSKKIYQSRWGYVSFLLCIVLMIPAFMYRIDILSSLLNFINSIGIHSRTVELLLTQTLYTSGRTQIHESIFNLLNQHPFMGLGIGGDYANINESVHSLFIGIFSDFGYFVGFGVLFFLVWLWVEASKKAPSSEKDIIILYLCLVVPRGFTGGDMWSSDVFWWLLGLSIMVVSNKPRNIIDKNRGK